MDRTLKIFCDLVETRSFSETGRCNHLTQPAISRHLKAFEEKIGKQLIGRQVGQVWVTLPGLLVYKAAQDILKRYHKMKSALREVSVEVSGLLRIATIYSVGLHELETCLPIFLKRYPKVDLQLTYHKVADIYDLVLAGEMDLGIVAYPKPHSQLVTKHFRNDHLVLIVSPKHPWAKFKKISLKQLEGQPFVAMYAKASTRKAIDAILRKARVRVRVVHAFDNVEVIKRAVEVENGVSIVPQTTVRQEVRTGVLKQLTFLEGPFERPIEILTRKHAYLPLPAQKFIDTLLLSPPKSSHKPCSPVKDTTTYEI